MAVDEGVERSGYPDAAFGLDSAETDLQELGVGGVHLEAHCGFAAEAPPTLGLLPAEVVDSHTSAAVAEDAVLVAGAFGAEVGVGDGVLEDASGGDEVIETAGLAGGGRGGADEVERAVWRHPVDRDRLDEGVAVDEDDVLRGEIFVREER